MQMGWSGSGGEHLQQRTAVKATAPKDRNHSSAGFTLNTQPGCTRALSQHDRAWRKESVAWQCSNRAHSAGRV
eukprot:7214177-Lingulodinium_polyedra.AAC.1